MKYIAIIPARYASTRFPGKPLAMLGGKTVVQRVYEQVSSVIDEVCVATDDQRIYDAVSRFGGRAVMTSSNHRSGTDRVQEAVTILGTQADVVINVQGDEPFIQPSQLQTVCQQFDDPETQIATLGKPFSVVVDGTDGEPSDDSLRQLYETVANPNSPKIVVDNRGFALYFSRSIIPFVRGVEPKEWPHRYPYLKHIGLYAYRREVLAQVTSLLPSSLEVAESLEQLRWLQNGYRIRVGLTDVETVGIDTPDDLLRAERMLEYLKI